ncbi:hypothetical protein P7L54_03240 [Acinetobacter bereziniae]|jgi:hypothetical protein|uniref:DUF4399 domain-containing protein n=3 Tax=Acinetobacter bereziniae TaxID=106648 RepID=N9EFL0_ACIBZ|nr:hypothetical protein [Acinetobacter bereziniae]ENV91555.1 hypothetical protein F938_03554 [Acinetobacter bereziniae LMG 1003 = CIP 70.12]MBJ9908077.1 hypothetical protein [Acinetobacter bereziniae]MBJ9929465.1 hypothetical protein [Acinetobacter bereziniae]MDG3554977.1 hypothetical protein [Acinetobacter bereziniae]MDM1783936.1 hypothetical protein [Acinetobacter bereziniae]
MYALITLKFQLNKNNGKPMYSFKTLLSTSTLFYSLALYVGSINPAMAQPKPTTPQVESAKLQIVWPIPHSAIPLGNDSERAIGVIVSSNFKLLPAGQCGNDSHCGHIHMKIDPQGDSCNLPNRSYNSMNSDFGGPLIKANFGACTEPAGEHTIGVLLANDQHQPVLIDGKPVIATVQVKTTLP